MAKQDIRVTAYIAEAPAFAQPILTHFRKLVHAACPAIEETIKWGFPFFMYKGMLCSMAAFKQHCAIGFHPGSKFRRVTSMADMPTDAELTALIRQGMKAKDAGIKPPRAIRPKKKLAAPQDFLAALVKNKKAKSVFGAFTDSQKNEYVEWVVEAKREETRVKRIETAVTWIAEGKQRNWKYM